jgi:hypothetical protein
MSHPNNLSDEYPCQGDTWQNTEGTDCLTVTLVSPLGVIHYMKGIGFGSVKKHRATVDAFKKDLERYGLDKPHYCTDKYVKMHGAV